MKKVHVVSILVNGVNIATAEAPKSRDAKDQVVKDVTELLWSKTTLIKLLEDTKANLT